jgi:hypothetical protein
MHDIKSKCFIQVFSNNEKTPTLEGHNFFVMVQNWMLYIVTSDMGKGSPNPFENHVQKMHI